MKTTATVLLVLAAILSMAPALGAEAGSSASAYADWWYAEQETAAWANNGWEYANANTIGASWGSTASSSGAIAGDWYAAAATDGTCNGIACYVNSSANAIEWDSGGVAEADSGSGAVGVYVEVDSSAYAFWGPPISAGASSYGLVGLGNANSSAWAAAYI